MSEVPMPPIPIPGNREVSGCLRSGSFTAPTKYFRSLSPAQLSDMVIAGITIIDEVIDDELHCIATPEPLVLWSEGSSVDELNSQEEKQLSRLMAALETLALSPIPDGQLLARYAAMGGEVAKGLGRRADARKLFAIARNTLPMVPQYWMGWAGSLVPFVS